MSEEAEMAEKVQTEINRELMKAVRSLAESEGRDEGAVIEEALVLFLMLRNHFVHSPTGRRSAVSSDILSSHLGTGSLDELFERIDRGQRERGVEPLSEEEALRLADEELHTMRRERRTGR
jgi:hypothetical protein